MFRTLAALLIANCLQTAITQIPPISAKVPVEIESLQEVSSQKVKKGQLIPFKVVLPVKVDGMTMIEAGTIVSGEVTMVRRAGIFMKDGAIDLAA
jgi:hypothetical protein